MPTDTFSIAVGVDDAEVLRSTNYPPDGGFSFDAGASTIRVRRSLTTGVAVGLFRFDTSALPDVALITAAILRFHPTAITDLDGKSLTADWYDFETVGTEDYVFDAGVNAHAGTLLSALTAAQDNDLALLSPGAYINKTGYTGIRLHLSDGVPTGVNQVTVAAFENAATEPRLLVTYTEPVQIARPRMRMTR